MTTAVIHSRDDDGRSVVGVPLSNRKDRHAWLYEADYEALLSEYGFHPWFVNDNGKGNLYVRMKSADRRNNVMVARLMMRNPLVKRVRYLDGDTLNLRSRNLDACVPDRRSTCRGPVKSVSAPVHQGLSWSPTSRLNDQSHMVTR